MVSGNAIVYIYFISNCKTSKCDKEISFKSLLRLSRERSRVVGFHLRKSAHKSIDICTCVKRMNEKSHNCREYTIATHIIQFWRFSSLFHSSWTFLCVNEWVSFLFLLLFLHFEVRFCRIHHAPQFRFCFRLFLSITISLLLSESFTFLQAQHATHTQI